MATWRRHARLPPGPWAACTAMVTGTITPGAEHEDGKGGHRRPDRSWPTSVPAHCPGHSPGSRLQPRHRLVRAAGYGGMAPVPRVRRRGLVRDRRPSGARGPALPQLRRRPAARGPRTDVAVRPLVTLRRYPDRLRLGAAGRAARRDGRRTGTGLGRPPPRCPDHGHRLRGDGRLPAVPHRSAHCDARAFLCHVLPAGPGGRFSGQPPERADRSPGAGGRLLRSGRRL